MNIRDLEAFLAVVETGSIVGASARLHVTQPGITRRIQNLEERLGATLLDRQSKPLKPTAAGRQAYEHGRQVLRSLGDLMAGVSPGGELRRELRIGVVPYLSETALVGPLDRLRGDYPKLSLRMVSAWSPSLVEQVAHGALDAAVVCLPDGAPVPEGLAGDELGVQRVLLVAAASLDVPNPADLAMLANYPWVMNENGCGFRAYIRNRFEAQGLHLDIAAEVQSAELRLSLVARGMGIGIVTPAAFAANPGRDDVRIIDTPAFAPQVRAWLLYRPPVGQLARPLAVFRAALVDALDLPASIVA
ncbi:LysR family transcriptional regulator [Bordetella genomosp. 11]|uniref:LysR family transcriptional regulator n=1 Tax=Bordetella genomosp. 11 TaxID=1416808 RepID=A0A261UYV6_9BORD|nr:LysR family transcriptional regulator [Bordetella genomosp. 11]OZI66855.1 LysR family transcriptional regulator [Bordetella genomosp. 11]